MAHEAQRILERSTVFWAYGSGSIASGIKNHAFSYLLLSYSIYVLNISPLMASLALAIAMIWDAVTDPLLGQLTDKTRSRLGRRHPYMYVSLLVLPAAFWLLFNPLWELDETGRFVYLVICALLVRTGTTLFEVPSVAQLPQLEPDYYKRNRWLSLRVGLGWFGGNAIHTANFFFWVGVHGEASATGYGQYATWGAAIIFVTILLTALGTQRHAAAFPPPTSRFRFSDFLTELRQMAQSLKNRNFASLFAFGVLTGVSGGLGAALYIINVKFYFGFSLRQAGYTGVAVLIAPFIGYMLAPLLGKRFGKRGGAMASYLTLAAVYPVPFLLVLAGLWPPLGSTEALLIFTMIIVFEVVVLVNNGVMIDSMMADVVEQSEIRTERRSEGLFYAARTFGQKAISAMGIMSAGAIIWFVGFDGISDISQVTHADRVNMAALFLPLYCGLTIAAAAILSFYRIERADHENHLRLLAARHATSEF